MKEYNGLRNKVPAFGGTVHEIGGKDRDRAIQQAFAQQMQALMREIYCRAAADALTGDAEAESVDYFRQLARECQTAALAYFEGLGLIQPKPPEQPQDVE